jgi:S1-C subfamily serine protease
MRCIPVMRAAGWPRRCAPWLLMAALVAPVAASAQEPLGRPARERAEELRALVPAARAELGVVLGGAEQVTGRSGVRVLQALPDRPAARAGIRTGDILLSLNGTPLGDDPARQVTTLMRDVEPGDTVVVVLHRDGSDQTVRVVTERRRAAGLPARIRVAPDVLRPGIDAGAAVVEGLTALRLLPGHLGRHRLELVAMNPGLGRYFGVDQGVLVADIAAGSALGLQAGDVLLSIGGRAVRDPAHARAILASYRPDEEVEFEVMRDRRRATFRGTTGEPG